MYIERERERQKCPPATDAIHVATLFHEPAVGACSEE